MPNLGTRVGQILAAAAPTLAVLVGCVEYTPIGTFEFEEYRARSSASPMPVAPPPAQGDHMLDVSLREIGATRTSGGELRAHPETGMHPLRTDGAISVRVARFFAVRALGSLGYGSPLGAAPSISFSERPSVSGGIGAVFGWWGERDWSIQLELDWTLVLLANRERYAVVTGPCFSFRPLFGGEGVTCTGTASTGEVRGYEGAFIVPALGGTLDVAGWPVPRWLRIGAGASVREYVSRDTAGGVHHEPVGIARVFVEVHVDDVWFGLEAQQWVVENATFAPALAVTIGSVAFERRARAEVEPDHGVRDEADEPSPSELGWNASAAGDGEAPGQPVVPPVLLPPTHGVAPSPGRAPVRVPWIEGVAP